MRPAICLGVDHEAGTIAADMDGAQLTARVAGEMPWPLSHVWLDNEPAWVCRGASGIRRQIFHDDFIDGAELGTTGWQSYTPTITQSGPVTKTVVYARYIQIGKKVTVEWLMVASGAGTTNNPVTISLPVTAAQGANLVAGKFYIFDNSALVNYQGVAQLATTTTVQARRDGTLSQIGVSPNFALANLDELSGSVTYEAANYAAPSGWIRGDQTGSLVGTVSSLADPADAAGVVRLTAENPNVPYLIKQDRAVTLTSTRVYWLSARVRLGAGAGDIAVVGLANNAVASGAATAPEASVSLAPGSSTGHVFETNDASGTTANTTGETLAAGTWAWLDIVVRGDQWGALWLDGSGPWVNTTTIPSDTDQSLAPFIKWLPSGGSNTFDVDCVTLAQVDAATTADPTTFGQTGDLSP